MATQIYFIDSKLNDYQTIVNSLSSTDIYYIIDSSSDGLTQMSNILSNYSNLDSIHVYSHGDIGSLNLGNTVYDNTNISNYKIELENIGKSLSSTGDILLYGCNVGQDEVGKNFINQIAQFSQADVAASDDLTGNKVLGGDWNLEVNSGVVETKTFEVKDYQSVMADDHSDTMTNATVLTLGIVKNGNIEVVSDEDYFKIDLTAGKRYLFQMLDTNTGTVSLTFNLYDKNGTYIDIATEIKDGIAQLSYIVPTTGTYYLKASDLLNSSTGTYSIKVSEVLITDDYSDSITGATALTLGIVKNGNIEVVSDKDYFKIDLTAGKRYLFQMLDTNTGTVSLTFNLYDKNGTYIDIATEIKDGIAQLSYIVPTTGTYYLKASDLLNSSTGTYSIKVSEVMLDDHSDTTTNATALTLGIVKNGNIEVVSDEDYFKIDLTAGKRYLFQMLDTNTGTVSLTFNLYDKNGTYIDIATEIKDGIAQLSYIVPTTGTYYLKASDLLNSSTGTYSIKVSEVMLDDHSDTTTNATALTLGIVKNGNIEVVSDKDYFKIDLTAGKRYLFQMLDTNTGTVSLTFNLYDKNGTYIDIATEIKDGIAQLSYIVPTTGTYYLKASDLLNSSTGTYSIKVSEVLITDDYSDSITGATALTLGIVKNGNIEVVSDKDYFKIDLTAGKRYLFQMLDTNTGTVSLTFNLYDKNGTYIDIATEIKDGIAQLSYIVPTTGTYYLKASDLLNSSTGTYSIKVSEVLPNTIPTITSGLSGTVTENAVTSTVIYKATATDADANTTLAYSLSGTDASLLNINSSTGAVTLKSSANYEAKKSYSFNVIASDGSLTATKAVVVNVTNVNEFAPTSANKIITINEDIAKVLTLTDFVFSDADSNSTLSKVKITQLETKGSLKLNGVDVTLNKEILASDIKANKLTFTPISNEFGTSYSNFKFQVSDGTLYSTSSYTTTFNVTQIVDTVSKSTSYTLPNLIENLTLTGTVAINGTGNSSNNIITGNSANNILSGLVGNDTLDGKSGIDTLIGGLGNDTYVVDNVKDVVTELASQGTDTINSYVSYTISSNVENLNLVGYSLINGIGNTLNNTIIGNSSANTLDGKTGVDIMLGGAGNDTYYVDNIGDKVYETTTTTSKIDAGGTDTVNSSISYVLTSYVEKLTLLGTSAINGIGNTLNNTITGNSANNVLNGGTGIDTLIGGLGNDTYIVDITSDKITEALNAGIDTVNSTATYTLSTNVENLTLTGTALINGTGNELANTIIGNSANNVLNGKLGNDTLNGGLGNDTLYGELGNDILNGAAGADIMLGGAGNDTYYVDNSLDKVYETKTTSSTSGDATGIDTVNSSISYTLTSYVENLTLTGTSAINGTGNTLNNVIIGNSAVNTLNGGLGNDILNGGLGNDMLYGGLGLDKFVFNTAINSITNKDTIKDFNVKDDTIHLENAIFTKLATTGILNTANFVSNGTKALDSNDFLIYNKTNGQLFYDADGNGTKISAIQIALIENKAALTYADFTVI